MQILVSRRDLKMMQSICRNAAIIAVCLPSLFAAAQNKPKQTSRTPSTLVASYPDDALGVMIETSEWTEITEVMPSNTELKRGLAPALTYGIVPATVVAQFDGQHAEVQFTSQRPLICVCRAMSSQATPLLVKLHPKKGYRELYGGKLRLPGAKIAKATESDIVPSELYQPEERVWLLRPKSALPPGEYALTTSDENLAIFPFTVYEHVSSTAPATSSKR
jgi:hypothetical protein